MRYLKTLGLAAIAAAALMAFAGSAAATMFYKSSTHNSTNTLAPKAVLHAEAESEVILHPIIGDIKCKAGSTVQAAIAEAGAPGKPVTGTIGEPKNLTWKECNGTVNTITGGTLEASLIAGTTNASVKSTGAEVTAEIFGFHCIFSTNNTPIGTLTDSQTLKGATATFDISATIPRTGGRSGGFCGPDAEWTGSYKIDNPDRLDITDS
jgi:hypothetical protein